MRRAASAAGDALVGRPERGVFAFLGLFLPETSVLKGRKFQHLLTVKFLADAGRDSVKYAVVVAVIYNGGGVADRHGRVDSGRCVLAIWRGDL